MITDYFCQNQSSVINFTTDDVISKFELFSKNMMNNIYITESMRKYWMHILDEYLDEEDTPYSDGFNFWIECLYQYFNELPLVEDVEIYYIVWKS